MGKSYKNAGVDLEAGYESVRLIKDHVLKTKRPGMVGGLGSFGGLFDLSVLDYKEPILVSGTDGVGTKLKIAQMVGIHDTIGEDLVAMCVNDVLVQGAEPLFFLDYIGIGKNVPQKIEKIVKGVASGCVKANCALIGGETAEMPDMYDDDEYDLAGFAVGIVEKSKLIDQKRVQVGDSIIGIKSSGIHSNGYSLVRKILFKDHNIDLNTIIDGMPLKEIILEPTRIYVKAVLNVLKSIDVHAIAHITGGGFDENIPRALNDGQGVRIFEDKLFVLPIFAYLETLGKIDHREMFNIFNMGVGMILIISPKDQNKVLEILEHNHEEARVIGEVINQQGVFII